MDREVYQEGKYWIRHCPSCGKKQKSPNKSYVFRSTHKNCVSCANRKHYDGGMSEDQKKKISDSQKLRYHRNGMTHSIWNKGLTKENHPALKQMSEHPRYKDPNYPKAVSKAIANRPPRPCSEESKRKLRIAHIKRLEKNGGICPMHNPNACKYLDKLSEEKGWSIQHAGNNGEFHIRELGYFVDGYDEKRNIVIEYDEPAHAKPAAQKKDRRRQKEIIEHLNCEFYRYLEWEDKLIKVG